MAPKYYSGHKPHRSRLLSWLFILGLVILIIWLLSQWLQSLMHPYTPLNNQTKIAQVRVIQAHEPGYMDIELKILAGDGHQISDINYLLKGNMWRLEGELITVHELLNKVGVYSSYKLTRFDGRYNPAISNNITFSVAIYNGGDDEFFKTLYSKHAPVIQAFKMYSFYIPADGKFYNVFVIQNGLSVKSAS